MCRWGGIVSGARFWGAFLGLISGAGFWGWFLGSRRVGMSAPPSRFRRSRSLRPRRRHPCNVADSADRVSGGRTRRHHGFARTPETSPRNQPQKRVLSQNRCLGRVSGVRGRGCRRRLRDSGDGAPCGLADGPCDLALPTAFLAAGRAGIMDSRGPQKRAPETSPRNEFSVVGARPAESNEMPGEGLEPSSRCRQRILSPPCLPFHHPGRRGR